MAVTVAGVLAFVLAILAAISSVTIGVIVWFSERKNRLRTIFLWLAIFVALWIISNVLYAVGSSSLKFPLALVSYGAAVFVSVTMLAFVWRLLKVEPTLLRKVFLAAGYVFGIISSLPGVVGMGVEGIAIITNSYGLIAYGVVVVGFLLAACIALFLRLNKTGRVLKRQIRYVLFGIAAAATIGVTFNLILPMLGEYRFTQLGPAGATLFIIFIAYSIARYSLFDIRLTVVRAVAYIATLITLVGVYFGIAYIVSAAFDTTLTSSHQTALNVGAALLMALLLQPIKRFFDKLTNKIFYRENYNSDEFYARLNKVLSTTTDLRSLLERAAAIIADTLKSDQTFFFVQVDEGHFTSSGTAKHARMTRADAELLDERIQASGDHVVLSSQLDVHDPVRRMLVGYRIALAFPLQRGKETIGYILLGERRSGDYTRRDLTLLATIADALVVAVQNAQSLLEVKELNSHLEQRVAAATKELRMSNAQLQKLDEAKDEFISMASHQLRTPLTSIKGYISMLMDGDMGEVTAEQRHVLKETFTSSERMVRLIGDFLNVSRLQTGKFVIDKHPVNLTRLVEREIDGITSNASTRGITFTFKPQKNIPTLELDENKIQQVVMNFLDNAMYYSKDNGVIAVSLKKASGCVELRVKDNGIGVPKSEQVHLFHKFFRATNARRARPDGTGVGLFLARKVVNDHDGDIIFESKEGKGSTFGFSLPLPIEKEKR